MKVWKALDENKMYEISNFGEIRIVYKHKFCSARISRDNYADYIELFVNECKKEKIYVEVLLQKYFFRRRIYTEIEKPLNYKQIREIKYSLHAGYSIESIAYIMRIDIKSVKRIKNKMVWRFINQNGNWYFT